LLRIYLAVAVWVLAISALGQITLPRRIASGSVWGFAPGWQREIGFFDIAMALIAFCALRANEPRFSRSVAIVFVILTALIGTNHLYAVASGSRSWVHVTFTVVNYTAVAIGCAALLYAPRRPSPRYPQIRDE
jgi:cell division protein FtsW (lipid II flippase)